MLGCANRYHVPHHPQDKTAFDFVNRNCTGTKPIYQHSIAQKTKIKQNEREKEKEKPRERWKRCQETKQRSVERFVVSKMRIERWYIQWMGEGSNCQKLMTVNVHYYDNQRKMVQRTYNGQLFYDRQNKTMRWFKLIFEKIQIKVQLNP